MNQIYGIDVQSQPANLLRETKRPTSQKQRPKTAAVLPSRWVRKYARKKEVRVAEK